MESNYIITPKSKVMDVIKAYPELETALIEKVPVFEKLKNPVLRNTVAKVATLQQAANIGHIEVGILVNHLRQLIGQTSENMINNDNDYKHDTPAWFVSEKVTQHFDVRQMLARGEHPVAQVLEDLKTLPQGDIYALIASFLPAPLIDKATAIGFDHFVQIMDDDQVLIYFIKK